ncbi:MAG: hypothetical protein HY075_10080 [Deltaproteobacteria bacterium]|nr:hypothetical protein [Deltaproteobacteria bacterium]
MPETRDTVEPLSRSGLTGGLSPQRIASKPLKIQKSKTMGGGAGPGVAPGSKKAEKLRAFLDYLRKNRVDR